MKGEWKRPRNGRRDLCTALKISAHADGREGTWLRMSGGEGKALPAATDEATAEVVHGGQGSVYQVLSTLIHAVTITNIVRS